jgi:hypothetical protein
MLNRMGLCILGALDGDFFILPGDLLCCGDLIP